MKRTKTLRLGLLGSTAFAALMTISCADEPVRRCVDDHQIVVEDDKCGHVYADTWEGDEPTPTPTPTPTVDQQGVAHPFIYPYRWYYGGPRAGVPVGTRIEGGGFAPPAGAESFAHPTSRGIIGHSAGGGE